MTSPIGHPSITDIRSVPTSWSSTEGATRTLHDILHTFFLYILTCLALYSVFAICLFPVFFVQWHPDSGRNLGSSPAQPLAEGFTDSGCVGCLLHHEHICQASNLRLL